MTLKRLKWICKAIEYDRLLPGEAIFLYEIVDKLTEGKEVSKTDETTLERTFTEVQWREKENKELVHRQNSIPETGLVMGHFPK